MWNNNQRQKCATSKIHKNQILSGANGIENNNRETKRNDIRDGNCVERDIPSSQSERGNEKERERKRAGAIK